MASGIINRARFALAQALTPYVGNNYNQALFKFLGAGFTQYDSNGKTYIEKGYNDNPDVFSVVTQKARKAASIPFYVKEVKDKNAKKSLDRLRYATKGDFSPQQIIKEAIHRVKAYQDKEIDLPLARPNIFQTWDEFIALYETFMNLNGNAYIYMLKVENGTNTGKPLAIYLLPSHLMKIVLRKDADLLNLESPIDYYMMIEGQQYIQFKEENVIHVKTANPNFDLSGSHLYGLSPVKAIIRNIQASNEALDNNIKTMQNGGAFGFLHSKGNNALTPDQAAELKNRMLEMDASPERLSKISGVSAEIGFTRISLTTDELKPFDYLNYNQEQTCNVFGWSIQLLNREAGALKNDIRSEQQRVLSDTLMPSLDLLANALNDRWLKLYKGYENTVLEFDPSELPEMQLDMKTMSEWIKVYIDSGVISRNEVRSIIKFATVDIKAMDVFTVSTELMNIEDAIIPPVRDLLN